MKRSYRVWISLLPAALLLLAHLTTLFAILSFGGRAGGYPRHVAGLITYGLAAVIVAGLLGLELRRILRSADATPGMLVLTAPAIVSLVLVGGLWMTPWVGGAAYPPYDPSDSDIILLFGLLFAAPSCAIAVIYGSYRYLIIACAIHAAVYWGTYSIPAYLRYPEAGLLAAMAGDKFAPLLAAYALGALLVLLRLALSGRRTKAPLWIGATLACLAGAWGLHWILRWLPENGDYLGYIALGHFVPEQGWDWTRTAAQGLAMTTMVAAVLTAGVQLWRQGREPR
ncbi:MAG: hypothetical protein E3J64_04210 [Anaerolineales bacterium]|nr:MAG: hypothetical protein E3J64_04210 [Anaerolineales bacterium]